MLLLHCFHVRFIPRGFSRLISSSAFAKGKGQELYLLASPQIRHNTISGSVYRPLPTLVLRVIYTFLHSDSAVIVLLPAFISLYLFLAIFIRTLPPAPPSL
ncbi:unnamed protein product [Ixodes persulcatus]